MTRKRIVIVDDDCLLCKSMHMCLSERGHDVEVFGSSIDAVKYLSEEKPDSIVLDIRLPDCDGWFVARLLEKLGWSEKVPIIVMSVLEPDRGKIAEVKPYAYIQKPFDMGQLVEAVERSLGEGKSPASA